MRFLAKLVSMVHELFFTSTIDKNNSTAAVQNESPAPVDNMSDLEFCLSSFLATNREDREIIQDIVASYPSADFSLARQSFQLVIPLPDRSELERWRLMKLASLSARLVFGHSQVEMILYLDPKVNAFYKTQLVTYSLLESHFKLSLDTSLRCAFYHATILSAYSDISGGEKAAVCKIKLPIPFRTDFRRKMSENGILVDLLEELDYTDHGCKTYVVTLSRVSQ